MNTPPIFDGHNDVLTELYKAGGVGQGNGFITGLKGHLDAAKTKQGGFGGGFFAIWVPPVEDLSGLMVEMEKSAYDVPLVAPMPQPDALAAALAEAAVLNELEAIGALRICTSVAAIEACLADGTLAAIMHMEGADAIDPDFNALDVLWRAGLRSIGPVWSRNTIYGEGVPFSFPSSPDIGSGLTEDGERFVRKCNALGLLIDLSHLNEAGFWDVARLSDAPLVATHSNAHAICPHSRNLTDRQLQAIADSDGMVGLNFATAMLREDGRMIADTPISLMLRHLDHMLSILGEDRVGLGSDFDGAVVPAEIGDASGLPHLRQAMRAHGYSDELIEKICFRNWLRVLNKTWKD
ncbi:MAG: dipeptidase [Pseudomonadota bacterium]